MKGKGNRRNIIPSPFLPLLQLIFPTNKVIVTCSPSFCFLRSTPQFLVFACLLTSYFLILHSHFPSSQIPRPSFFNNNNHQHLLPTPFSHYIPLYQTETSQIVIANRFISNTLVGNGFLQCSFPSPSRNHQTSFTSILPNRPRTLHRRHPRSVQFHQHFNVSKDQHKYSDIFEPDSARSKREPQISTFVGETLSLPNSIFTTSARNLRFNIPLLHTN